MAVLAQGQRVILRNLKEADLAAFQAYRRDPVVAQFQSWNAMTDDHAMGFLRAMSDVPPLTAGSWTQIAVADLGDAVLGDMGLHLSDDGTQVELGISLARAAQGKGFATDAMRLAIALVWTHASVTTIRTWADQRNTASVRLCHRVGLTHLGTETNHGIVEEAFVIHRPHMR